MRFNASSIINKLTASTKAVDASIAKLESKVDLVTKWFEAGELAAKVRETAMWNLASHIEQAFTKHDYEFSRDDAAAWTFTNMVKVYFSEFSTTPEAKAFNKLDDAKKRQFAKGWSEVVAVTKATGVKASDRRKKRKQASVEAPSYRQVLAQAKALTNDEKQSLVLALGKELGISAKQLKVA